MADLLAHEKDAAVALHLFDHRLAEGLSESQRSRHRDRDSLGLREGPRLPAWSGFGFK
jgi:hypothetical protein